MTILSALSFLCPKPKVRRGSVLRTEILISGPPISRELQEVFGHFGEVQGILPTRDRIEVQYANGLVVVYTPTLSK